MQAAGIDAKLAPTAGTWSARRVARAAVTEGSELVLVCGGDGTLNEVINGLIPGNVPLGVLPGGTANVLARELGIPLDPLRAARDLPRWSTRRIAVGQVSWPASNVSGDSQHEVEQRYFLSVAGIGFDAYIVKKLSTDFKMSLGAVAYGLVALRQVVRYAFPPFICQVEGSPHIGTFAVVHRTSRYAGWLHLAPGADIFEPRFSLCIFRSNHWARYLLYAAAVVTRQHLRLNDIEMVEATKIVCSPQDPKDRIFFELDGESVAQLPATFEIVPDALTLLVP